jgi:TldD protein
MTTRRDFLRQGGALAGAAALSGALRPAHALDARTQASSGSMDAGVRDLLLDALNAATLAGAGYADARIARYLQNFVITREQQIVNVVDTDSIGIGVRALVDGTWGFAASRDLTKAGVTAAAREAVAIARANRVARDKAVVLAPAPAHPDASWKSAYEVDPWTIPVEEKADLLIKANAEGMKAANVKYVFSGMFFRKMERNYANTDGSVITQSIVQSAVQQQFTAVSPDFSDFQNRSNTMPPVGHGYEWVLRQNLVESSRKWGEEASEKLKAKPVEVGGMTSSCIPHISGSRFTNR